MNENVFLWLLWAALGVFLAGYGAAVALCRLAATRGRRAAPGTALSAAAPAETPPAG